MRAPELSPVIYNGVRKRPMNRFPYSVVYRVMETKVVVVAIMHHARYPSRWQSRV